MKTLMIFIAVWERSKHEKLKNKKYRETLKGSGFASLGHLHKHYPRTRSITNFYINIQL